ncbi:MAG TPA: FAD-dependent oxidoreductase [Solirubrobacteraceae bacterium]|nr:FAD-dependent oxidoreductase [Solirubrobacteraceae bacterium]
MPDSKHEESELAVRDILIVGAGIAGMSSAIALARRGARVTVLDHGGGAVGASILITHRAVYGLEELGVLDRILEVGRRILPSERSWWTYVFNALGERLPVPAPVLDDDWSLPSTVFIFRPLLAEILTQTAIEQGAEVLLGHTYQSIQPDADGIVVELTTGERRRFDLLIAADGINSGVRAQFFPEIDGPVYTGSMSFRMMFRDAPEDWLSGLHVAKGGTVASTMLPGRHFYLAVPNHMERRRVEQEEARAIVRTVLSDYEPSKMFAEASELLTDDIKVIVAPYEWIFVEPPWHRGRIVLVGDAAHATAPTIGSAGGMAVEDAVVLVEELSATGDLDRALASYAARRDGRARLVVDTSAALMRTHQERRPPQEEAVMRLTALQKLAEPY